MVLAVDMSCAAWPMSSNAYSVIEPAHRQAPLADEGHQRRDQGLGLAVTEREPDDGAASEHGVDVHGDLGADRRCADDHKRAAGRESINSLPQHRGAPGGLDDTVRAGSASELSDDLGKAARTSFDGVGRAKLAGQLEPLSDPVPWPRPGTVAAGTCRRPCTGRTHCPALRTTSVLPGRGASTFQTAPTPVWTPQPSGATSSSGTPGSILITLRTSAMARSENDDCPKK